MSREFTLLAGAADLAWERSSSLLVISPSESSGSGNGSGDNFSNRPRTKPKTKPKSKFKSRPKSKSRLKPRRPASASEEHSTNVQRLAESQIELLAGYYDMTLIQARTSFNWAVAAGAAGLVLFVAAIVILIVQYPAGIAAVSTIGGAIVETLSGLQFLMYGKATAQLAHYHQRLDQTQRLMQAENMCNRLKSKKQQETLARIAVMIVRSVSLAADEDEDVDV